MQPETRGSPYNLLICRFCGIVNIWTPDARPSGCSACGRPEMTLVQPDGSPLHLMSLYRLRDSRKLSAAFQYLLYKERAFPVALRPFAKYMGVDFKVFYRVLEDLRIIRDEVDKYPVPLVNPLNTDELAITSEEHQQ